MTDLRPRRSALFRAFLGSFAVYLLPIMGPHFVVIWGVAIAMELASDHHREPLWLTADLALAVGLQLLAFALLYWMFRRPAWWRIAIMAAAVPVYFAALLMSYMVLIPTVFLVERDTARALGGWPTVCSLADAWLDTTPPQIDVSRQSIHGIWVTRGDGTEHLLLDMPDCVMRPRSQLTLTGGSAIEHVTSAGDVLYRVYDKSAETFHHELLAHDGSPPIRLAEPPADPSRSYWAPLLSADGTALAWLRRVTLADGTRKEVVQTRDIATGSEVTYQTGQPPSAQLELLYYDSRLGEFLFSRYPNSAFAIDGSGQFTWGPFAFDDIEHVGRNVRRVSGGWVAWDAYRENGRCRIAWSLPTGSGFRDIPKGRAINSVSATSSGDLIAVSVSRSVSIGRIQDAVFVFRASDGSEVYRRYLPQYTRTPVQFLGTRYLAMSTLENGKGQIAVMQVLR
ncbi:MAG: hypothetical protein ACREEE_10875 [Dongiaceae bacterium]